MRAKDIAGIAALDDEVRRKLYLFVCSRPDAVGRDEAAQSLGLPHHRAKFHLDKLEESGLLRSDYRRLTGRTGPGAGRPAKVYSRAAEEVSLSLPARDYGLAGELMARAITRSATDGVPVYEALAEVARSYGRSLGDGSAGAGATPDELPASVPQSARKDTVPQSVQDQALIPLRDQGYEPYLEGDRILMHNCPFHALARTHTELVCRMNHALLSGMVESTRPDGLRAELDPAPGRCCVTLSSTSPGQRLEGDIG